MGMEKLSILGNDYVGAWVTATDKFFLIGNMASQGDERIIGKALGVDGIRAMVGGSGLIGIYVAANTKGILLPYGTEERELDAIRQALQGLQVEIFHTSHNALKNNILANDKLAIINPNYDAAEEKKIADILDVETVRLSTGGFSTVGANNIMTNKGFVLNNRASDEEHRKVEEVFGKSVEQSTANRGAVSIGICTIANSNGLVVGQLTTGFEMARIAGSLEIE